MLLVWWAGLQPQFFGQFDDGQVVILVDETAWSLLEEIKQRIERSSSIILGWRVWC